MQVSFRRSNLPYAFLLTPTRIMAGSSCYCVRCRNGEALSAGLLEPFVHLPSTSSTLATTIAISSSIRDLLGDHLCTLHGAKTFSDYHVAQQILLALLNLRRQSPSTTSRALQLQRTVTAAHPLPIRIGELVVLIPTRQEHVQVQN